MLDSLVRVSRRVEYNHLSQHPRLPVQSRIQASSAQLQAVVQITTGTLNRLQAIADASIQSKLHVPWVFTQPKPNYLPTAVFTKTKLMLTPDQATHPQRPVKYPQKALTLIYKHIPIATSNDLIISTGCMRLLANDFRYF